MNKPIKLKCSRCAHEWSYKGNSYRAECKNCRKLYGKGTWIKTGLKKASEASIEASEASIQDNILRGNILDAMKQMGKHPLDNAKLTGDYILHILDDDKLVLALNKACEEEKKKPAVLIKKAVKFWLEKEGYL